MSLADGTPAILEIVGGKAMGEVSCFAQYAKGFSATTSVTVVGFSSETFPEGANPPTIVVLTTREATITIVGRGITEKTAGAMARALRPVG